MRAPIPISSLRNPRTKQVLRLRRRPHRDKLDLMLIEGYRELARALDHRHPITELFYCRELFLGSNEDVLIRRFRDAGASLLQCTADVFRKISYRDRPDGLLAVASRIKHSMADIVLSSPALLLIMQAIEKPGNLGTILRSADGAGADGVVVCDPCTDINNPNVVRASVGTLFAIPVVEESSDTVIAWLREHRVSILTASPHATDIYTNADLSGNLAIVVGTEQYGLSETWITAADCNVRIPMRGDADSLNVASAATLLLYEAVRQRQALRERSGRNTSADVQRGTSADRLSRRGGKRRRSPSRSAAQHPAKGGTGQ